MIICKYCGREFIGSTRKQNLNNYKIHKKSKICRLNILENIRENKETYNLII